MQLTLPFWPRLSYYTIICPLPHTAHFGAVFILSDLSSMDFTHPSLCVEIPSLCVDIVEKIGNIILQSYLGCPRDYKVRKLSKHFHKRFHTGPQDIPNMRIVCKMWEEGTRGQIRYLRITNQTFQNHLDRPLKFANVVTLDVDYQVLPFENTVRLEQQLDTIFNNWRKSHTVRFFLPQM